MDELIDRNNMQNKEPVTFEFEVFKDTGLLQFGEQENSL